MTPSLRKGFLLALGLFAAAAPAADAQQARGVGRIPFDTYTLPNGLRVILSPDPSTPVVAVSLWYNVAARNERPGLTGFAHLFEHMMFEGSQNVGKGEHMTLLQRAGAADLNGTTSEDRTNYYEIVPPNRLNLALWLEADRMRSLNVTAENLKNQQEVVKEEKRMRVDNVPYTGAIRRLLSEVSYNKETCFAYGHQTIGSMEDLDAAKLEDVQQFFRTYYAPSNATLTLVGDFDPAAARAMIEQYFGSIPAVPAPPEPTCTTPFSHFPVRETVQDRNATLPAFMAAHGIVPDGHPDSYPLSLLGAILGDGESSRLNQRLVKRERAANVVFGGTLLRRGPGLFVVYSIANQGVTAERLETLVNDELEKVRTRGVTAAELTRAKNRQRAQTIRGLETAFGRAEALQRATLFRGDPNALADEVAKYQAVTREDILRVARQYLTTNNRAVIHVVPAPRS